jgi:hypothetical protein
VIAMSLRTLHSVVCTENRMLTNFHSQVGSGMRLAEDNGFDNNRDPIESKILSPGVYKHINYAALSLNNVGVPWFGTHHITLADHMIEDKASVFEENAFTFYDKHITDVRKPVPTGYKASWPRRHRLAIAKLYLQIDNKTAASDFPSILIDQVSTASDSDFIEVHIYDRIHPQAIVVVSGMKPRTAGDRALWNEAKIALRKLGTQIQERS